MSISIRTSRHSDTVHTGAFIAAQALVAGPPLPGLRDPVLVGELKNFFARARPGSAHSTFSFPSGHTTAAAFYSAAFAVALLPRADRARLPPHCDRRAAHARTHVACRAMTGTPPFRSRAHLYVCVDASIILHA